jgi:hypothetical protein
MSNQLSHGDLFKNNHARPACGMTPAEREAKLWKLRSAISGIERIRTNINHQLKALTVLRRRLKSQLEELL